jgi:hypothetical protein
MARDRALVSTPVAIVSRPSFELMPQTAEGIQYKIHTQFLLEKRVLWKGSLTTSQCVGLVQGLDYLSQGPIQEIATRLSSL